MVNKERAANIAALNDAFRQQPLAILPHSNRGFELSPRVRLSKMVIGAADRTTFAPVP